MPVDWMPILRMQFQNKCIRKADCCYQGTCKAYMWVHVQEKVLFFTTWILYPYPTKLKGVCTRKRCFSTTEKASPKLIFYMIKPYWQNRWCWLEGYAELKLSLVKLFLAGESGEQKKCSTHACVVRAFNVYKEPFFPLLIEQSQRILPGESIRRDLWNTPTWYFLFSTATKCNGSQSPLAKDNLVFSDQTKIADKTQSLIMMFLIFHYLVE